jgi:two-component system, NarL family, nitrate/nitrite response regulator NarL
MNIVILSPVRLLGDGLADCLNRREEITVVAVVADLPALRQTLSAIKINVVLIDVMQFIDLDGVRAIASERPDLALVALGLRERRQDVIRCGRAGFSGYVARNATLDELSDAMMNAASGCLACPAEISGGLLRALFRLDLPAPDPAEEAPLTRREGDVLQLIGRGLTNKEIARELSLSVATVKHHVHNVLYKMRLPRRAHAMRRVRDMPWLATWPELNKQQNGE